MIILDKKPFHSTVFASDSEAIQFKVFPFNGLPRRLSLLAMTVLALFSSPALAQTPVSFGLNWLPQPEHGGFYQALADGTYKKYGLDVTIVKGGANINNRLQLASGKLDFYLGGNLLQAFSALEQNVPTKVVGAVFAKDPQCLLTHPDVKNFSEIKSLNSIYISKIGMATFFPFLKAKHGFEEGNIKPYTFSAVPFIENKHSAMQGYVTSEPFIIEKRSGIKPNCFLLSDYGFDTPSNLIETNEELLKNRYQLKEAFLRASIEGWRTYLFGDNALGNALIKQENTEITDDLIAYAVKTMKEQKLVEEDLSGRLDEMQIKRFFETMKASGVASPNIDPLKILAQ